MKAAVWAAVMVTGLALVWLIRTRTDHTASPPARDTATPPDTARSATEVSSEAGAEPNVGGFAERTFRGPPDSSTVVGDETPRSDAASRPDDGEEPKRIKQSPSRLREFVERLDDGLASDPAGDIGQLVADLLLAAVRLEDAQAAILAALDRDGYGSRYTRPMLAFALGSLAARDGKIDIARFGSNSAEYWMLLLGARWNVRGPDGALSPFWHTSGALRLAVRGALRSLKGFHALADLARTALPNEQKPTSPYSFGQRSGRADLHYWGAAEAVRPLPRPILHDLAKRLQRGSELDSVTRRFIARQVLMRGRRDGAEAALAAQWLLNERDGHVRHDLLTAGNFAGLTSDQFTHVLRLVDRG